MKDLIIVFFDKVVFRAINFAAGVLLAIVIVRIIIGIFYL